MRTLVFFSLCFLFFAGCKKEAGSRVEIYLLQSFTKTINQATMPATVVMTNSKLSPSPLVADNDIARYNPASKTFLVKKDLRPLLKNLGPDKGFAVTVDKEPVYVGLFHPSYMSSLVFGLATIDPLSFHENELKIHYVDLVGDPVLQQLDKRNHERLIRALKETGRLR